MDTPLPIPNREVKHCSGEGSRKARIASRWALFCAIMDAVTKLKQLIEEEISKEDTNYQETAREINSLSLRNFYDGIDKDVFLLYLCELGYLKLNINGNKKVDIGEKSISLDLGLYFKDTLFNGKENKVLMFPLKAKLEFISQLKDFDDFKEKILICT